MQNLCFISYEILKVKSLVGLEAFCTLFSKKAEGLADSVVEEMLVSLANPSGESQPPYQDPCV